MIPTKLLLTGAGLALLGPTTLAGSTPTVMPGWPLLVAGSSVDGGLLIDMDGDGDLELVQAIGAAASGTNVLALHHDGTPVSGWPKFIGDGTQSCPAAGDIDGDGDLEIVLQSTYFGISGDVHAWHLDGSVVSGWPRGFGGPVKAPSLGDVDGDGDLEVLTVQNVGGLGQLYALDDDGSTLPGFPLVLDHVGGSGPSIGDLDGDGDNEIVCQSFQSIYALDHTGSLLPGFPFTPGGNWSFNYNTVSLADLDRDGDRELVFAASLEFGSTGRVYVLEHDGSPASGWPKGTVAPHFTPASVADIDGDGWLDVVQGNQLLSPTPVNTLEAWDRFGNSLAGFPVTGLDGFFSQTTVCDVDGDGRPELLHDQNVAVSDFLGWNHDGTAADGFPLAVGGSSFLQMLSVGDVDADGDLDLVGSGNHIADGNTEIVFWTTDTPWIAQRALVPTYQYDIARSGVVPPASAWLDVGGALLGLDLPELIGTGDLQPLSAVSLELRLGFPSAGAFLVAGLTNLSAPFKQGVMVPNPDVILGPLALDGDGGLLIEATWPAGLPAALTSWWQMWIPDPFGPSGFAASNGLEATTP